MTKQTINRRGWQWLMLLALLMWLVPQQASADGSYTTYVDMSYNYSVTLDGANTIKIHVPVYVQEGSDCWIKDGKLKVSWEGQSEITLFRWQASEDIPRSAKSCRTTFSTEAGGYIDVTLGNTSNSVRVTASSQKAGEVVRNNDAAETYDVTAIWYVPYHVLGKKLSFKWDVRRNGNDRADATLSIPNPSDITVPSAGLKLRPVTSDAMLSAKKKGKIEVPWFLASDNIYKIQYQYTDYNDNVVRVDMDTAQNNGTILLDANVPHRDFRIVANYRMKGEGTSFYEIEGVESQKDDLTMIHAPLGLRASVIAGAKPKVEVKWNAGFLSDEDFALTDFFEIQRSLTGKEEDFVTIGQQTFTQASKSANYTFVDSTIIESIKDGMLVNGGTLDNLTYRVRRTVSQIWGWDKANNCASSTKCIVDNLHLLRIANYSAKWEDERAHTVRVTWNYADDYNGVWDNRAKMILHVTAKNRSGKVVDDRKIELNSDDRQQRYKVVNMTRSCVTYDIEMYVERDKSPINYLEDVTSSFFPIRTSADWTAFRDRVKTANGKYDVNARLYADVNAGSVMVGSETENYYRGTFDGNGHTLTFNINTSNEYAAPFRYVGNATFRNLHTTGTIRSSRKFIGGIVGGFYKSNTNSTVVFEGCRSSVTLNSSVNGDATNGGLMAIAYYPGDSVAIRNCKFDGSLEGAATVASWAIPILP